MSRRCLPGFSMRNVVMSLLLVAAACGDLEVRSVRAPQVVPAALAGEWVGTWQSTAETSGPLVVRVQEYGGEPVVRVEFTNPCIEPRSYDLVVTATTIELRAEGGVVMAAILGSDRTLSGTYQCPAESGTWSAVWTRDLPSLADLSGSWSGTLAAAGQPVRSIGLELTQEVAGGVVQLGGLLTLPELWPLPVALVGTAQFGADSFELLLFTPAGVVPPLLLTGTGDRATLALHDGLLQAIGTPVLPFGYGVVDFLRLP